MRLPNSIRLSLALLVASTPALAKQTQDSQHHPAPDLKTKPAKATATATKTSAKQHHAAGRVAIRSGRGSGRVRSTTAELPPPDRYLGPVHVVGRREVGSAAWYGGRHIGMRTASGDRLDALRVTAAHRSLPLNSLVRVTNLGNGRSVIAKINDRGPYSHSLLIDVSPRAAQELDMIHSGIATVAIEPVAPAADPPHQ